VTVGTMDWGRGIWPYKTYWIWASGNGKIGQTPYGINLGFNMQEDGTNFSEDCIIVGSRMIKLATMQLEFNEHNLTEPWVFKSGKTTPTENYAVGNITFIPYPDGIFNKNFNAVFLKSNLAQVFGVFSGEVYELEARTIKFYDIPGFAENHKTRW
jgi:hypothetical protein